MNSLWITLIDYAKWTPSPHNVQAWKIKVLSDTQAELYYDPKRLLPVTDPTGCFSIMGFSMFIDTLDLVATKYNQKVIASYIKKPFDFNSKSPVLFANLELVPNSEINNFDINLIKTRRTSRLPYLDKNISPEILKEFESETLKFNQKFFASSSPEMVEWIMDLNKHTLLYDMGDEKTRKEIGALLRYNNQEAEKFKDGLWSYCMNMPGWFMKMFFNHQKFFTLPIIKDILLFFYGTTMSGTKTVAWIQGPFNTFDDYINCGYALNRLWLCMAKHDIYMHPFGSVITNPNAHNKMKEKFKLDESKEMVWLILRLGYSNIPPRSLRLDIEDILIK